MSSRHWFAASVGCYSLSVGYAWLVLPAQNVPLHFGADGSPDRFGSRGEALLLLCLLGVGLVVLLGGLARATASGRLSTAWLNVPHKEYWTHPEREPRMRRLMSADLYLVGAATMLLMTAIGLLMAEAARTEGSFGLWGWAAVLGYCLFMLGWMVRAHTVRYRPAEGA